jgi:hypothetical protein
VTVIDEHDGDCKHGIYPPSSCTRCNGSDARRAAEDRRIIGVPFQANFAQRAACGCYIRVGDMIARRADDKYVCEEHAHVHIE